MQKSIEFVKGLDKIIILAQGPSWYQCPDLVPGREGVEIWGSNVIYRDHAVDRLFFGHDPRGCFFHDDMDLFENLNKIGMPIYTIGVYKPLVNSTQIPVLEILEEFKVGFFLNVIAWMMATAILQDPKTIDMYGVDMRPDADIEYLINEKGTMEFWCGVAMGKGIPVENTKESYVMKTKQEGNFPRFRKKVPQNGLATLIQKEDRNIFALRNYMILPVGEEF
ncbi:hypothetical protein ES708_16197 [subsurface metagenome]